jgi:hypothetical protein
MLIANTRLLISSSNQYQCKLRVYLNEYINEYDLKLTVFLKNKTGIFSSDEQKERNRRIVHNNILFYIRARFTL